MFSEETLASMEELKRAIETSPEEVWFAERRHRETLAILFRRLRSDLIEIGAEAGIEAPGLYAYFEELADALPEMSSSEDGKMWLKSKWEAAADSEQQITN